MLHEDEFRMYFTALRKVHEKEYAVDELFVCATTASRTAPSSPALHPAPEPMGVEHAQATLLPPHVTPVRQASGTRSAPSMMPANIYTAWVWGSFADLTNEEYH